jgi:voltage-gated sodium channel
MSFPSSPNDSLALARGDGFPLGDRSPAPASPGAVRQRIGDWIDAPRVQRWIIVLVVVNAIALGLETVPAIWQVAGGFLHVLDRALLAVFVVEIALKMVAHGRRFFSSGWNVFDLLVIGIALIPASGALSVFRALRVLRILRVVSAIPKLRVVVESLARSLPGMGAISLLLLIFFYVFAVVATKLFGADFPQWFGTLWISAFSLFQIMTLEGWADISREVMVLYPGAWLFFVAFILMSTFTVLNLFIGLIVKAMEEPIGKDAQASLAPNEEIAALRAEIRELLSRPAGEARNRWQRPRYRRGREPALGRALARAPDIEVLRTEKF